VHAVHPMLQWMQWSIRLYGQMRGTGACAGSAIKTPCSFATLPHATLSPCRCPSITLRSPQHCRHQCFPQATIQPAVLRCRRALARGFNRREAQNTGIISIISCDKRCASHSYAEFIIDFRLPLCKCGGGVIVPVRFSVFTSFGMCCFNDIQLTWMLQW
jgi:hypothetical protein